METLDEITAKLPSSDDLVKAAIRSLRKRKPDKRSRARQPHPLWSRVGCLFCHGSGYSYAICRKYGFDPDETWIADDERNPNAPRNA